MAETLEKQKGIIERDISRQHRLARIQVREAAKEALKGEPRRLTAPFPGSIVMAGGPSKAEVASWADIELGRISGREREARRELEKSYQEAKAAPVEYTYGGLTSEEERIVKEYGIEEVERRRKIAAEVEHGRALAKRKAENVEVRPGIWYDRAEWGALTPEQQTEVLETGSYTTYKEIPPKEQFDLALKEGTIPRGSTYSGPTEEGGFEYVSPPTPEQIAFERAYGEAEDYISKGPTMEEKAGRLVEKTGISYSAAMASIKAHPGEYKVGGLIGVTEMVEEFGEAKAIALLRDLGVKKPKEVVAGVGAEVSYEIETAEGIKEIPAAKWEALSSGKKLEFVLGREPTWEEYRRYQLKEDLGFEGHPWAEHVAGTPLKYLHIPSAIASWTSPSGLLEKMRESRFPQVGVLGEVLTRAGRALPEEARAGIGEAWARARELGKMPLREFPVWGGVAIGTTEMLARGPGALGTYLATGVERAIPGGKDYWTRYHQTEAAILGEYKRVYPHLARPASYISPLEVAGFPWTKAWYPHIESKDISLREKIATGVNIFFLAAPTAIRLGGLARGPISRVSFGLKRQIPGIGWKYKKVPRAEWGVREVSKVSVGDPITGATKLVTKEPYVIRVRYHRVKVPKILKPEPTIEYGRLSELGLPIEGKAKLPAPAPKNGAFARVLPKKELEAMARRWWLPRRVPKPPRLEKKLTYAKLRKMVKKELKEKRYTPITAIKIYGEIGHKPLIAFRPWEVYQGQLGFEALGGRLVPQKFLSEMRIPTTPPISRPWLPKEAPKWGPTTGEPELLRGWERLLREAGITPERWQAGVVPKGPPAPVGWEGPSTRTMTIAGMEKELAALGVFPKEIPYYYPKTIPAPTVTPTVTPWRVPGIFPVPVSPIEPAVEPAPTLSMFAETFVEPLTEVEPFVLVGSLTEIQPITEARVEPLTQIQMQALTQILAQPEPLTQAQVQTLSELLTQTELLTQPQIQTLTELLTQTEPLTKTETQTLTELLTQAQTKPLTQAQIETLTELLTQPETLTRPEIQTLAQILTQTNTLTQSQVQTLTSLLIQAQTQTLTQAQVRTLTQLQTKVQTKVQTQVRTRIRTRTQVPFRWFWPWWPGADGKKKEEEKRFPPGTITWRQGFVRKYIPPPYKDIKPITKYEPEGSGVPEETIRILGGPAPIDADVDLGVVDIRIRGRTGDIFFEGGGLETNVGKRHPSKTKGMSVRRVEPMFKGIRA